MAWFDRLLDANRRKQSVKVVEQEITGSRLRVNALASDYENLFAQVTPLADEMMSVRPYGQTERGAKLPLSRTPELAVLNNPNDDMGREEFLKTSIITWLTEEELNIHVHFNKRGKVAGYTVLPVGCRQRIGGVNRYVITTATNTETLYDNEVMTLRYSRSPRDIDRGVSPANASHYWAQIDDLMAQYEKAYFENGAVPATITLIKASTRDGYDKKRTELERNLRGASNKNKTLYVWRQYLDDGSQSDEVEVKTIQGTNQTQALKEIFDIVTNKLNANFGVSNFILGNDSSAKYDNAELSDMQFTKRRVFPALVMFWGEFQHELDRITGGLGYAINFDLEIPELTDRVKTQAETKHTEAETESVRAQIAKTHVETLGARANALLTLVQAGADPQASVNALGLIGDDWLTIATSVANQATATNAMPMTTPTDAIMPAEMPVLATESPLADVLDEKTVNHTLDDLRPTFEGTEAEKEIYNNLLDFAEAIAEQVQQDNPDVPIDELKEKIVNILAGEAEKGELEGAEAIQTLVNDTIKNEIKTLIENGGLNVSDDLLRELDARIEGIIRGFQDEVKDSVAKAISDAELNGWTKRQLNNKLYEYMPTDRADLIARSESHASIQAGRYDNARNLSERFGIKLALKWKANAGACDVCAEMDGTTVPLGESYPEHLMTEDGEELYFAHNEYNADGREPNAHPNCRCTFVEVIDE